MGMMGLLKVQQDLWARWHSHIQKAGLEGSCLKPVLWHGSCCFVWGEVKLEAQFVCSLRSKLNTVLQEAVRASCFVPYICILHLWRSAEELVI